MVLNCGWVGVNLNFLVTKQSHVYMAYFTILIFSGFLGQFSEKFGPGPKPKGWVGVGSV